MLFVWWQKSDIYSSNLMAGTREHIFEQFDYWLFCLVVHRDKQWYNLHSYTAPLPNCPFGRYNHWRKIESPEDTSSAVSTRPTQKHAHDSVDTIPWKWWNSYYPHDMSNDIEVPPWYPHDSLLGWGNVKWCILPDRHRLIKTDAMTLKKFTPV